MNGPLPVGEIDPMPGFGPWLDPTSRKKAAVIGLVSVLVLTMTDALWSIVGILTVSGWIGVPGDGWFDDYDVATTILGGFEIAVLLLSGLFFIRWQRRMIGNTAFLGCEKPEPSSTVATFAWFIPMINLILPAISIRRIALWSRPEGSPDRRPLVVVWWSFWVLANLSYSILAVLNGLAEETAAWIMVTGADVVVTILYFFAGVLALKIVTTLTRDQIARAEGPAVVR